jgi:hypothetical protein
MNKNEEEEKSATSKPASPKTAKVILNDTDAVVVTERPLSDSDASGFRHRKSRVFGGS